MCNILNGSQLYVLHANRLLSGMHVQIHNHNQHQPPQCRDSPIHPMCWLPVSHKLVHSSFPRRIYHNSWSTEWNQQKPIVCGPFQYSLAECLGIVWEHPWLRRKDPNVTHEISIPAMKYRFFFYPFNDMYMPMPFLPDHCLPSAIHNLIILVTSSEI